jgi:hypothetical protein
MMKNIPSNYDEQSDLAFKNALAVHEIFDWEKVTIPAVNRLKKIYSSLELNRTT